MRFLDWNALDARARVEALARPVNSGDEARRREVTDMLEAVRTRGDAALRELTLRLDRCHLDALAVNTREWAEAEARVAPELRQAIDDAASRIETFHRACMASEVQVETAPGVTCERLARPIGSVGLYVPAGTAPLPSSVLMLGIPAKLAGCQQVILCSPPDANGNAHPAVLWAARRCGIERVFKIGGAQAIAAMAFGSESVPRCDKVFGPGNAWVTEAKCQLAARPDGVAIDLPAGPSELFVIADCDAPADFVAADLLSQAEHGPDSQVLLASDSKDLLDAVDRSLESQLAELPRSAIARRALASSRAILVDTLAQAAEVSNQYAPEHLILNLARPREILPRIDNAGSVFLGRWTPESLGDYCSGTNHVLPTAGWARSFSGLSVASFRKWITVQEASREGLEAIGGCAETLAMAESLTAHARAVSRRLDACREPA